jgi:hypothetical protein
VTLVDAIALAVGAHRGQVEKAGQLYSLARRVKIADLEDNLDLRRLLELLETDVVRMDRYRRAWAELKALKG